MQQRNVHTVYHPVPCFQMQGLHDDKEIERLVNIFSPLDVHYHVHGVTFRPRDNVDSSIRCYAMQERSH